MLTFHAIYANNLLLRMMKMFVSVVVLKEFMMTVTEWMDANKEHYDSFLYLNCIVIYVVSLIKLSPKIDHLLFFNSHCKPSDLASG